MGQKPVSTTKGKKKNLGQNQIQNVMETIFEINYWIFDTHWPFLDSSSLGSCDNFPCCHSSLLTLCCVFSSSSLIFFYIYLSSLIFNFKGGFMQDLELEESHNFDQYFITLTNEVTWTCLHFLWGWLLACCHKIS
jgi:hypothetical protein